MAVHVEWVTGVLRWAPKYSGPYDDFDLACTVILIGDTMHLCGMTGRIAQPKSFLRELKDFCLLHGIKTVTYARIKNNRKVLKQIEVRP